MILGILITILLIGIIGYLCYKHLTIGIFLLGNQLEDKISEFEEIKTDIVNEVKTIVSDAKSTIGSLCKEEKANAVKFGEVSTLLKSVGEELKDNRKSLNTLNSALGDTRIRGAWGERLLEDILLNLGLLEGINYHKQSNEIQGIRPDFTFVLPSGIKLNVDSKFPLNNYLKYHEASLQKDKDEYAKKFIKDVKDRVKEVCDKNYIAPENGTVDFAVVFIPNDMVLNFIMEQDVTFMDFCFDNKIIMASPWSMYVILAVVRQASHLYKLDKNTVKNLAIIQKFRKEWLNYKNTDSKIDKKLNEINSSRDEITGVRTRQLEKVLEEIDGLGNLGE